MQGAGNRIPSHPFNNFPRFPLSGVAEIQNIQARSHFLSAGANQDQDSHQFLGPVECPPLITVGSFLCASQEDWIAMTFLWTNPGHYQMDKWVFAGESNKEPSSMGDGWFEMCIFLHESILQTN